ncbi:hypothetical protein [Paraburkholderia caribensis]|uniref:hypothetical protein n=1 Tax=Paraburkholderia caribensis TaxID=75105 RepID=UPI001D065781|nr:hypothetical protein [Paraburkholderia caribensis]
MQWNTLDVPLENGWKCRLHPVWQYRRLARELRGAELYGGSVSRTRDGSSSLTIDDRQRELDRRDFDLHFRPRPDLRTVTGKRELDVIRSFLRDLLDVAHWNLPADNEGIEKALREAVASGRLVPVIDRERRALARVTRPDCAPERWASSSSGLGNAGGFGRGKWAAFVDAGPGPLALNGEPVLRGPYDPATREAQLKAAWAEMAASTAGICSKNGDAEGVPILASNVTDLFADDEEASNRSTGFSGAQSFKLDLLPANDNVVTMAARGVGEAQEAECFAEYEARLEQCKFYAAMTGDPYTYVSCKANAFAIYNQCRGH